MTETTAKTPTQMGAIATAYFESTLPKFANGAERYVATDGEHSIFVKSDYAPKKGEMVFYLKATNNGKTQCQYYKGYEVDDAELKSRIAVIPTNNPLRWLAVDSDTGVKVEFVGGLYEETKKVSVPGAVEHGTAATRVPRILAAIVEEVKEQYLYTCNKEARKSAIKAIGTIDVNPHDESLTSGLKNLNRWGTILSAFNGHWFADWEYSVCEAPKILCSEVTDSIRYGGNQLEVDTDALKSTLMSLTGEESLEVLHLVKDFWEAGGEWGTIQWIKEITKFTK